MLRSLKNGLCVALLLGGVRLAGAFALLGPFNEAYQIGALGYGEPLYTGELGGPKNIGEEYRWNLPVLYYAYDQSFLNYFGSNGVVEVEKAMAFFNNLTNVSSYSADLSEVPLETLRIRDRAEALRLRDLKSHTMTVVLEELGLADAGRFVWTLRHRVPAPSCPSFIYTVIKRNFDPVKGDTQTLVPSSYVNGVLATYAIQEYCPTIDAADAVEFISDPLARNFTAVASHVPRIGSYFTGFSRDDVGGLRYLLKASNVNYETTVSNATLLSGTINVGITNVSNPQLLASSNLMVFAQQTRTNDPTALLALYPNLFITSTNFGFSNVFTTNITAYFTNYPWSPVGSPPTLVFATNLFPEVIRIYSYTFGNVYTNTFSQGGFVTTLQTNVTVGEPWGPPGTQATNVTTTTTFDTNIASGGIFIVPTNICILSIVNTQLVRVEPVTNTVLVTTNSSGFLFSQSVITYFTNMIVVINPVSCPTGSSAQTNTPVLRQGIERISFVRKDFDSLLGVVFQPTNTIFTNYAVANNQVVTQAFSRLVNQPDILFSAADLDSPPTALPVIHFVYVRSFPHFNTNGVNPQGLPNSLAGPGTMEPRIDITFNKVGPEKINVGPQFIDERSSVDRFIWGSFDGTTNAPVVYPNGTDIANLESLILLQISPASLPLGCVGRTNYSATFTATGGGPTFQPPFSWSFAQTNSAWLPQAGTNVTHISTLDNGSQHTFNVTTARLFTDGPITQAGSFTNTIRLSDAAGHFADREYVITVTTNCP